jgi:hypothetical protein
MLSQRQTETGGKRERKTDRVTNIETDRERQTDRKRKGWKQTDRQGRAVDLRTRSAVIQALIWSSSLDEPVLWIYRPSGQLDSYWDFKIQALGKPMLLSFGQTF